MLSPRAASSTGGVVFECFAVALSEGQPAPARARIVSRNARTAALRLHDLHLLPARGLLLRRFVFVRAGVYFAAVPELHAALLRGVALGVLALELFEILFADLDL